VDVTAHVALPQSWSEAKKAAMAGSAHRQKPDIDNVAKAVLDALWPDGDEAVAWLTARKVWAPEDAAGSVTVSIHYDPPEAGASA
jgi:Holliday junction resolvase RusA-like endonuclease